MICYYGSWAVYRPEKGKYPVENIDPFLCTHVIYTFAGLGYDNKIRSLDPWNDLKDDYGKGAFERFTNLKRINPKLKTIIAIGGWNEGSVKYSAMVANPEARTTFVDSVMNFLERYNFDGFDLDWEYPASRGGKPEDKPNFSALVRELKIAFEPKGYSLSAAVSAGKWFVDPAYDVPEISRYKLITFCSLSYLLPLSSQGTPVMGFAPLSPMNQFFARITEIIRLPSGEHSIIFFPFCSLYALSR